MNANDRDVHLTEQQLKNMTDEQWAELLEEQRRERDNRGGLVGSRYLLEVSPAYAVYKLTDMSDDDRRYFDMSQHKAIIEWLHENGLGTALFHCDEYEEEWTYTILVRPQYNEADELLFKLRWWDEGIPWSERYKFLRL